MRWLDNCWSPLYTYNMTPTEHPCIDCPGLPHGCHLDKTRWICIPHANRKKMHQTVNKFIGMTAQQRVKNILTHCEGLTAGGAYNCVELFSGPHEVIWPLSGNQMREIDLRGFIKSDDVNWCMAANIRFKFWGGPPKKLAYYNGTLETLLKDRALAHLASYGIRETERMLQIEIEETQLCLF